MYYDLIQGLYNRANMKKSMIF